jgi:hypothetical protein
VSVEAPNRASSSAAGFAAVSEGNTSFEGVVCSM